MKQLFLMIALLCCVPLSAQVGESVAAQQTAWTLSKLLAHQPTADENASVLKLVTAETVTQYHDGTPVYRTVREVEYTIKENEKKISRKRKVVSASTEELVKDREVKEVYPDVTATLLCSVLSPGTLKKQGDASSIPGVVNCDVNTSSTHVILDKVALMKANGIATTQKVMGSVQQTYEVMTEDLLYCSPSVPFYLDQLKAVTTTVVLSQKEKSGDSHRVEVQEKINIQSMTRE